MRSVRTISRKGLNKDNIGYFISGFTEGEGSFNISLRKKPDYKLGWQVVLSFNISQKDVSVLNLVQETLNCGIIKTRKIDNLHSFDVTNVGDITEKIIPFFQKYPLLSESKKRNFSIFCEVSYLVKQGEHRNESGFKKILNLREKINEGKGRTRKYSINDVFPI